MPGERDISIYAGDTYAHELRIRSSSNTVINISSRTYSGKIKIARASEDIVATFTAAITDGANGVVLFSLSSANTANITSGTYYYDFQEDNVGVVTTLLTGRAVVKAQVG
ncbi:MAG: hypothetical protein RLZZ196_2686 [Bacteroidota bacterium]|jgi:hypothetical protein